MNIDADAEAPAGTGASPAPPRSAWTRPQRRQKEQLTRERIVAEAVRLLDEEGLEALSMRTLGQRLGAGATSLYRHVASKDELVELVADAVYGEMEIPEVTDPGSWRLALTAVAHTLREAGLRHMWLGQVLGQVGMTYVGPHVVDVTTRSLAILTTAGFSMDEASRAMGAVSSYVLGATTAESGWLSALRRNGYEEKDWLKIIGPTVIESAADAGLQDFYLEQLKRDPEQVRLENFTYGLDLLLDSLQYRLTARLADAGHQQAETVRQQAGPMVDESLQLPHNRNNGVTPGVWRGADGLVHKVLTHRRTDAPPQWVSSADPRHWNYWRREADVYRSGLPGRLGLGAPDLVAAHSRPDGDIELVLSDVPGTHGGDMSVPDIAAVAFALGRSQGSASQPSEPWFSRGFLRDYSTSRLADFAVLEDESAWSIPLIAKYYPPEVRAALVRMHRNRERLLDLMLRLPRTVCHLDVWPNNVVRRPTGEVVFLDWSFVGDGAIGEDAGNLVPDSFFDWPHRAQAGLAEELPEAVTEAYLAGLKAAGWRGDPRLAVLGMRASAVKYDWLTAWCLQAAKTDLARRAYGTGEHVDAEAGTEAGATGLAICARWADEAIELADALGL